MQNRIAKGKLEVWLVIEESVFSMEFHAKNQYRTHIGFSREI